MSHITTIHDVTHTDGSVASCYALVNDDATVFCALEVRRAQELQREGLEYLRTPVRLTEAELRAHDGWTWFGPDFRALGASR